MRLYLVSLVLVLFALCRESRAGVSWDAVISEIGKDGSKIEPKALELLTVTVDKLKQLDEAMGSTIFAVLLDVINKLDKMPKFYKDAIMNGVLCEFNEDLKPKILKALYGSETHVITEDQHKLEATAIAGVIDCAEPTKKDDCFCATPYNPLLFCFAKRAKETVDKAGYAKKTCRNEALETLKGKGTKQLGKAFDIGLLDEDDVKADEEAQINKLTSSRDGANLLCDALDTEVTDAVKALYASDAVYWTIDAIIAQSMYGSPKEPVEVTCGKLNENVKAIPFAKCICDLDKGISFCYYYHAAVELKNSGFLNCEDKKFDESKTKPKKLGLKGSGEASPNKDSTNTPANSTPLVAAPLVAAAVLLLRN